MDERLPFGVAGPNDDPSPPASVDWREDARALQILTVEHWSLLSSRSMSWNESFSRAGIFLTALSGSVVALALVGQSTGYGRGFVAFALILLPVVLVMGLATVTRLSQVNSADLLYVQAMNRLRHAYLELVPGVAPYFSTATHDDLPSLYSAFAIRVRPNPVVQGLVTTPALVSVICSVLTGVIAGILVSQIASGMEPPTAVGVLGSLACMIALTIYRERSFRALTNVLEVRFPRTE